MTEAERLQRLRRSVELVLEVAGDPELPPKERRSLKHVENVVQRAFSLAEHRRDAASGETPGSQVSEPERGRRECQQTPVRGRQ